MAITSVDFKERLKQHRGGIWTLVKRGVDYYDKNNEFLCSKHNLHFTGRPSHLHSMGGCEQCKKEAYANNGKHVGKLFGPRMRTAEQWCSLIKGVHPNLTIHIKPGRRVTVKSLVTSTCECGLTRQATLANLKAGHTGCPSCGVSMRTEINRKSDALYRKQVRKLTGGFITPLETYVDDSTKLKHLCKCGHTFTRSPRHTLIHGRQGCLKCLGSNDFSDVAIRWIHDIEKARGIEMQHALKGGEKRLKLRNGKSVEADGYHHSSKTVFEFHGDDWHGNPFKHKPNATPHPFNRSVTAKELFTATMSRHVQLNMAGYNVVYVWESDYRNGILVSGYSQSPVNKTSPS